MPYSSHPRIASPDPTTKYMRTPVAIVTYRALLIVLTTVVPLGEDNASGTPSEAANTAAKEKLRRDVIVITVDA